MTHRGLDHAGVERDCIQDWHYCGARDGLVPAYDRDGITLYQADCIDALPFIRGDIIVTDPPYNAGKKYGKGTDDAREWPDWCAWLDDRLDLMLEAAPEAMLFLSQTAYRHYVRHGRREISWSAVWVKPLSMAVCAAPFMPHWEHIVYFGSRKKGQRTLADGTFAKGPGGGFGGDVFTANIETGRQSRHGHPTPKPLVLMRQLLSRLTASFDEPPVIIDPFAGSGTTLRAAKDLGLRAVGVEIEPVYCETVARRLSQDVLLA